MAKKLGKNYMYQINLFFDFRQIFSKILLQNKEFNEYV